MKIVNLFTLTFLLLLSSNTIFAQLDWVPFNGEIPDNVVIGGVENHINLPVCRANYKGAKHPGKVFANACNIGYGGAEKVIKDFEILVNNGVVELDWLKSTGPNLPEHAIKGGTENGLALYIGRAIHKGGTHPGKIFKAGNYICNIGYGGKEITYETFEVLVETHSAEAKELKHSSQCDGNYAATCAVGSIGSIKKEQKIQEGYSLVSNNLDYQTRVSDDGRLIVEKVLEHALCDDGRILILNTEVIWTNTDQKGNPDLDYYLKFQDDGNLCIYSGKNTFVWCSMSNGRDGHHFEITNMGHIEVVNSHGGEVWPD